jgi:integrase/recombinase XerD
MADTMFEVLFIYPKVLARHQAGPAAVDWERYLAQIDFETKARALAKCETAGTSAAHLNWRNQPALMDFPRSL